MHGDRDFDPARQEPEASKFRALFDYWRSRRNGEGLVLRASVDPVDIPHLLANVFLVDVVRDAVTRYRFRLVGTRICNLEGNITGTFLDELDRDKKHLAMLRHYDDACAGQLYIRDADLGWMGKEFRRYRVMLLPLHGPAGAVDSLIGLADYAAEPDAAADGRSGAAYVPVAY